MASLNASFGPDLEHTPTYLNLPENIRSEWLKKIRSFPPGWIQKPVDGERFKSHELCLQRLNAYGFFEGCLFVTARQGGQNTPHWYFRCKFHGAKSRNYRKLEDRVTREDDRIVTERKRDTQIKKRDCPVLYYLSHKIVNRDTKERAFIGIWREEQHQNHQLHLNPFGFSVHEQSTDAFQLLAAAAYRYRSVGQTYSKACQLLKEDGNGLILGHRTYYNLNLLRQKRPDKDDSGTITALLQGLKDDGFIFQTRTDDNYRRDEDGTEHLESRKLIQIFFYHLESAQMAQRFVAGHSLMLDGTFNTNKWRLPLLVAVGVTNENKTFPIAFSFCPNENCESYNFLFDCLRAEIFIDGIQEPGVIIADQATGLLSSIDTHNSIPHSRFQICNWHTVEAMMAKFRKTGKYTCTELEGSRNENKQKDGSGLKDYCWDYVKSSTLAELKEKKKVLLNHLQPSEQAYIRNIWGPKEERIITCHTRLLPNLGANSSQRVEKFHSLIKEVVQGQFSLAASTKKICQRSTWLAAQLRADEDMALMNQPTALNIRVFQRLIGTISLYAITLVETEWMAMTALLQQDKELGQCIHCDIFHRFSLPCRHYLRRAYEEGIPIPQSLVHPRWWLRGPVIRNTTWKPFYSGQSVVLQPSPPHHNVLAAFHSIIEQRGRLEGEDRAHYDRQILQSANTLSIAGQQREEIARFPIQNPEPIPKKQFRRVGGARSGQNKRGMTANELVVDQKKEQRRQESRRKRRLLFYKHEQKRIQKETAP